MEGQLFQRFDRSRSQTSSETLSEGEGTDVGSEDNQGDTYFNDRAADFETMKGEGDEKADGKSGADEAEEPAHEEEEDEDEMVKYLN